MAEIFQRLRKRVRDVLFALKYRDMSERILEIYSRITIRSTQAIRRELKVNERIFFNAIGADCGHPKDYVFYGALDEVSKANYALLKIRGFLGKNPKKWKVPVDDLGNEIHRQVVESIFDEIHSWQRKLIEILINLLNFKNTNEDVYYENYLAVKIHDEYIRLKGDLKEFYNLEEKQNDTIIEQYRQNIQKGLAAVNPADFWFLNKQKFDSGGKLVEASFRSMFLRGLLLSNDEEKLVIGLTYDDAFGRRSASLHNSVGTRKFIYKKERIISEMMRTCTLGFHIIKNIHELSGIPSSATIKQFQDMYAKTNAKQVFQDGTARDYKIGDLVLVYGEVGEVTECIPTKYGYVSFKVKSLTNPPAIGVQEQIFMSYQVRRLCPRSNIREHLATQMQKMNIPIDVIQGVESLPESELFEVVKKSAIEWYDAGLFPNQ